MVNTQVVTSTRVYIQMETTNQSFIDMHYYLKRCGVQNNNFFLVLYDSGLAGVDPRDNTLPADIKARVLREIMVNYWYFLREVVRIPEQGGSASGGARYKLDRASLAMNFLFILNYNMYVELPRQTGKTTTAKVRYLYIYNFGTTNSKIMFLHKDHSGSKDNLKGVKEIRDALPEYLRMDSATGMNGKKLKVPNTIVMMQHPLNNNQIVTFPSAKSADMADKLGRGCTMPLQYYDEFAFIPYNQIVYTSAIPAYSRASENAKSNGAPYGIVLTSTPGELVTNEGKFAKYIADNSTKWDEAYYDYSYEKLEELREANTKSAYFLIRYTYQQLGRSAEWFAKQCTLLVNDWPKIRREILLEWSTATENCAFSSDDLDIIKNFCREPIRTIHFGRVGQYQFNVYEDIDLRYPPIVGVDVSGASMRDSSAITVVDSRTTRVTATFACNFIPGDDLADLIYVLINQYMPNAVVNIERNGGFGVNVIQRLVKTNVKKNLYYEIKEKVIEETFNGHKVSQNRALTRVFGLDSTPAVRARLIDILYERVRYHKDKFIAPVLLEEMSGMEVKKSGKVEHSNDTHDDQVFSYLMALYVWYDGHNIMENFNIMKNTIKTDEDVEIIEGNIEADQHYTAINLSDLELDASQELIDQYQFIENSLKDKLQTEFNAEYNKIEEELIKNSMATDRVFKNAYEEHYNIEKSDGTRQMITLPNEIFEDDDFDMNLYNSERNGNLYNMFMNDQF